MKRLSALLLSLVLIFSFSSAFASNIVPDIDNPENCVVDMADVISQETENYLSSLNYDLYEQTGASVVIATVDFTGSLSMEEYAYEAFNKWGIGSKNNGLLLLMSVGQEDYWAVQGKALEKDLTSSEIDQMLWDYLEDDFAKGDYDAGAKSFYLAAYEWFGDYYDVDLLGLTTDPGNNQGDWDDEGNNYYNDGAGINLGKIITWIVIIFIVIVLIAAFSGGSSRPTKVYPRHTQRRGPHTSSYRRTTPPPPPTRTTRIPFNFGGSSSKRSSGSSSSRSTTSRSSSTRSSSSSSFRSSSSSRSSSRSGGFGGGSSRGGGAGRRK